MDNHIKYLVKSLPNDQDLGREIRKYITTQRTCCDLDANIGCYLDQKGTKWSQCKECGKILKI